MSHETSQVAIQDRPLLSIDAQPGVGRWTEIGEAEVIQTIFGKAKVRIIRKHDQTRRRAWLLTALAVTTIGVAAWQSWLVSQHVEPQQTVDIPLPVSAKVQVSEPVLQPETVAPPAPPSVESTPATLSPAGISKPVISKDKETSPPQSAGSQADEAMAAKRAKERPSKTNKPQPAPLAADNSASVNQSDKPLQPALSEPKQPPIAAVVATPRTTKIAQPAASGTAAVAPLAVPPVKEDTSNQSPARGQQPPLPIDSQSK